MLARLPALALVALGAVDALPVHEPEPLAPAHQHHAAHVHAKHGSVLDGLRELELDLEALTARGSLSRSFQHVTHRKWPRWHVCTSPGGSW